MAKRIIKHGDGDKPEPLVMECPICGCEFAFEDEDVKHLYAINHLLGVGVHCPECNTLCASLYNDLRTLDDEDE